MDDVIINFVLLRGWQNNASPPPPKDVHLLIPETWDSVTLPGESNFVDVIKLKVTKKGDYSWLSR